MMQRVAQLLMKRKKKLIKKNYWFLGFTLLGLEIFEIVSKSIYDYCHGYVVALLFLDTSQNVPDKRPPNSQIISHYQRITEIISESKSFQLKWAINDLNHNEARAEYLVLPTSVFTQSVILWICSGSVIENFHFYVEIKSGSSPDGCILSASKHHTQNTNPETCEGIEHVFILALF
jgi:hypothetical protein